MQQLVKFSSIARLWLEPRLSRAYSNSGKGCSEQTIGPQGDAANCFNLINSTTNNSRRSFSPSFQLETKVGIHEIISENLEIITVA